MKKKSLEHMLRESKVEITAEELLTGNRKEPENIFTPQTNTRMAKKFGKWEVSKNGDLDFNNGRYFISADRLNNDNWIAHLFEKAWIDWNEFIPAYFQACKNAGIQKLQIKIHY
jgi:hypothetical protein